MNEFDFIGKYLTPLAGPEGLGLKDDAAVWTPPAGQHIVISQDTMVEGVHFPRGEYGAGTAEKLLRVNLSDLSAKGATPIGYTLSLTLPRDMDPRFLAGFAKGLEEAQALFDVRLFGGDTTRHDGNMVISATCFGSVPAGKMVRRSGAQIGDLVFVTGLIGQARLGLDVALQRSAPFKAPPDAQWQWEQAYHRPEPRLGLRKALRKYASAALDISDGLIADAGHLARASNVQIIIDALDVPLSPATQSFINGEADSDHWMRALLTGGDDYEILGTVSADNAKPLMSAGEVIGLPITLIGEVKDGQGVICRDASGAQMVFSRTGYTHF